MVARILQDGRYLGSAEYPRLLSPKLFHQAQSARPDVSGRLERPEIKDIRVLARCAQCGEPMRRMRKNYWYCSNCMDSPSKIKDEALILCVERLLRGLRERPETIAPTLAAESENKNIQAAQERLDDELERPEFNEAAAKAQVIALASARFDALGSGDYETMRLRHLLGRAKPCDALDSELLRQTASAVLIYPSGAVRLKLKNRQMIGG